jgi:hypothetical protein
MATVIVLMKPTVPNVEKFLLLIQVQLHYDSCSMLKLIHIYNIYISNIGLSYYLINWYSCWIISINVFMHSCIHVFMDVYDTEHRLILICYKFSNHLILASIEYR